METIKNPEYGEMFLNVYGIDPTEQPEKRMRETDKRIYKLLREGHENAISCSDLSSSVGVQQREVVRSIQSLRLNHFIAIGSMFGNPFGYYLISNPDEFYKSLISCENEIFLAKKKRQALLSSKWGKALMNGENLLNWKYGGESNEC